MLYTLHQVRWLEGAEGKDQLGCPGLHRSKREQASATWCVLVGVNSHVPAWRDPWAAQNIVMCPIFLYE